MLFSARTAMDEGRAQQHRANWVNLLEHILSEQINLDDTVDYPTLNDFWTGRLQEANP